MLSEIMTQLLLLVGVLSAAGSLIAFVMILPNRMRTIGLELSNEIKLLRMSIDNLRRCHERLEGTQEDHERRLRTIEHATHGE